MGSNICEFFRDQLEPYALSEVTEIQSRNPTKQSCATPQPPAWVEGGGRGIGPRFRKVENDADIAQGLQRSSSSGEPLSDVASFGPDTKPMSPVAFI